MVATALLVGRPSTLRACAGTGLQLSMLYTNMHHTVNVTHTHHMHSGPHWAPGPGGRACMSAQLSAAAAAAQQHHLAAAAAGVCLCLCRSWLICVLLGT